MKTIRLISAVLTMAMLFTSSALFAQLKVGTNPTTIGTNANLEVEASTAGRKVIVDKTSGQVTIADGTQAAGKVLTSDANGAASWQSPGASNGYEILRVQIPAINFNTTGGSFLPLNATADFNTIPGSGIGGDFIHLPAGRFRVTTLVTAAFFNANANNYAFTDLWVANAYYQGLDWGGNPFTDMYFGLTGSTVLQLNVPGDIQLTLGRSLAPTSQVLVSNGPSGGRSYIIVEKMQ